MGGSLDRVKRPLKERHDPVLPRDEEQRSWWTMVALSEPCKLVSSKRADHVAERLVVVALRVPGVAGLELVPKILQAPSAEDVNSLIEERVQITCVDKREKLLLNEAGKLQSALAAISLSSASVLRSQQTRSLCWHRLNVRSSVVERRAGRSPG